MGNYQTKYVLIKMALYHILSSCLIIFTSLTLIILQTVFSYYIPVGSDMAWPSVLIPFGYIPASLLFLTAGATLATGLTNSELWQATSVVCCILPLITTIAIACTTLQQYMDTFPKNSSILIMGVISCLTSLLCFIHAILICVSQHFFHLP
ncbi:hypothetical protein MS3_00002000 [Schistosoma haematobium]|uniref:Uncharacterized protein n=1 Tax=Schistosoma haematobium TaxID=6185 RepID=A0A922S754_SCHHA|nr:hypothetical protein MS3_00002000 [Schistosoma haematobium]KAH9596269.1 hypothetical protein MS3_00002000 [Schistosoma haematobium]